jgi:hypothetical protein
MESNGTKIYNFKMTEFLNLQVYGVPIATYGLVGITTAVLAYATSVSELGETVSKSITDMTESPMSALDNMNPLKSKSEPETGVAANLNPFSSSDESAPKKEEGLEEPDAGLKGGKRRRNKTPKSKQKQNDKKQRGGVKQSSRKIKKSKHAKK